MSKDDFSFDGFEQVNTTLVPDVFFDVLLPHLNEAQIKVMMYIIRRTLGFKKSSDAISLKQFRYGITTREGKQLDHGCGLKNFTAITKALKSLEEMGCIESEKQKTTAGDSATTLYSIHFRGTTPNVVPTTPKRVGVLREKEDGTTANGGRVLREKEPQETVIQQTDSQETVKQERKKEPSLQTSNVATSEGSFIPSFIPNQSSSSQEVVFPQEAEQVYQLAEQLHITYLKRNEQHRDNCTLLAEKGVTTLEKMESLIQHCKQVPFLQGKTLNLKNLVNELAGWLQLQRKATAAATGSVSSTHGRSTMKWIEEQKELQKRILAEDAARVGPRPSLKEIREKLARQKQEAKEQ